MLVLRPRPPISLVAVYFCPKKGNIMKLSVIIPAYNCEKYIVQALTCIQTQDFDVSEIEIIIVLDCCTDNTAEIVKNFIKQHPHMNIRVITHDVNMGPAVSRNDAIAVARGDYIHFMDADDCINTSFYRRLYDACAHSNADVAVSEFINERYPENSILFDTELVLTHPQDKLDITRVDMNGYSCRYLISRRFWLKNKFCFPRDIRYCEDMLPMTQMVIMATRLVCVPDARYIYKFRTGSMLTTKSTKLQRDSDWHHAKHDVFSYLAQNDLQRGGDAFSRVRYKLFGILPVIIARINAARTTEKYYLFGILPILKVRLTKYVRPWRV